MPKSRAVPDVFVHYVGIIAANGCRPATFASIGGWHDTCHAGVASARSIRNYVAGRGGVVTATIYKICDRELWQEAVRDGVFRGAPIDLADGFIHFSTASRRPRPPRHFAGQADLLLVAIDAAASARR